MGIHSRPFVTLKEATFRLGDRLVFENCSWVLGSDEHWAVLGPNGGGKSLFADALRGKLPLVKGELRYHFRLPRGMSAEDCIGHLAFEDRKAEVHGHVVQSRWNSFEIEQEENVASHLSFERVMDINPFELNAARATEKLAFERRRRRAIEMMEVGGLMDRRVISLSNGETQKVQLAKELCRPLRLLILDEPFNGLDVASRKHFVSVLGRLMQRGLRLIVVTSRPGDLPNGITHGLVVENCRIVEQARAREIKWGKQTHPKTRTTKRTTRTGRELVVMKNVTVRYGATVVLKNINWTVREGESWALVGPNGSGKTTLLSLIVGDHPQVYANEVIVFGHRRGTGETVREIRKQIGFMSPELHAHFADSMSCLEAVESGFTDTIGLFERVTAKQRRHARGWLERFGLLEFGDEPLFSVSAGLSRMVLLARALVKAPRLLILDEPCQGVDARHRDLFLRTVDGLLTQRATTAIYVTHRSEEIPSAIRQVMKLRK